MQVEVYLEQEVQSNIYCDNADSLQQPLANTTIFLLINVNIEYGGNN